MDAGTAGQWASALVAFVALATSIWAARSKRHEDAVNAIRQDIGRAFSRLDSAEQKVGRLEGEMRHLPDKDAVHELKLSMTTLKGQMDVIIERVGPIKAIAERMQEVMMEHPTK